MRQRGFVPIIVVSVLFVAALAGGTAYLVNRQQVYQPTYTGDTSPTEASPSSSLTSTTNPLKATVKPTLKPTTKPTIKPTPTITPKPTATPTPTPTPVPLTTCGIIANISQGPIPLSVNLTYSASTDRATNSYVTGVQWDFGSGSWDTPMESSYQHTSHTYIQPGTYHLRMHLTMSDGRTSNICTKDIIASNPKVVCEIHSYQTSGPAPLTVEFYYGASWYGGNGDDYVTGVQWDFTGDGVWDTPMDYDSMRPTHTYDQPGSYAPKMRLTTLRGLTSDVCTGTVTVYN